MKPSITEADRRRVAEWITDAQQLLAGVEHIEQRIALTLGFEDGDDREIITDAVNLPLSVDRLLRELHIDIEEPD